MSDVMYKYSKSSSKVQFAVLTSVLIVPMCSPFSLIIRTPPGPVAKTFPDGCTFKPSNSPLSFFANSFPSKKTFGFLIPSFVNSYFIIIGLLLSELATYKVFSSLEILIPLGLDRFFINNSKFPLVDNLYTPLNGISFNSSLSSFKKSVWWICKK